MRREPTVQQPVPEAPAIHYGPAAWVELPQIYRLHRACFPHPYALWRFVGYHLGARSNLLVAVRGGQLVGYLALNRATHFDPPRLVGEIVSLAVAVGHRRLGIGRTLLGEAHRLLEADGIAECLLQVAVGNQGAQRLYEQMGYAVLNRLRRYYATGEDAWLMCRNTGVDRRA